MKVDFYSCDLCRHVSHGYHDPIKLGDHDVDCCKNCWKQYIEPILEKKRENVSKIRSGMLPIYPKYEDK